MLRLGWFGGSFNPVHMGHITMANRLLRLLDRVYLMPTGGNIGKQVIEGHHRLAMLRLALESADARLLIDSRELNRPTPTYTIDSLREIRAEHPEDQINFILGADALLNIESWKDYQQLTDYANLLVLEREGVSTKKYENKLASLPNTRMASEHQWRASDRARIYFFKTETIDCSSTRVRSLLIQGKPIGDRLIDRKVMDYIQQEKLYQH